VSDRPRVLVELGEELDRVAREVLSSESTTMTPAPATRRWWHWRAVPVVAFVVLGGTAAAFASGLISFGAPAKPSAVFSNPRAGLGALKPGTVKLLPISTADPHGGPPWGLRVLSTTRGAGCIQVGRLVDGKLAALGQDGAFGNDGRAHALPVSTPIDWFSCTLLDGKGQFFNSVTLENQAASAAWWFLSQSCVPFGTRQLARRPLTVCPQRDERDLYFGLLGPEAKSITYTVAGQTHTEATIGPEGAYLIVTDAPSRHLLPFLPGGGAGTADDVPVDSPISSIQYRNGATCHLLTSHRWIAGSLACSPSLPEPVGYVPTGSAPARAQVAAPIEARLTPGRQGRTEITVSFKSRVAITNLRGEYQLEWHNPSWPPKVHGYTTIGGAEMIEAGDFVGAASAGADIAAGQTLTATIGGFGPALTRGVARGTITLRYSTGPSLDGSLPTAKIPVGSFAVRIP